MYDVGWMTCRSQGELSQRTLPKVAEGWIWAKNIHISPILRKALQGGEVQVDRESLQLLLHPTAPPRPYSTFMQKYRATDGIQLYSTNN